MFNRVKTIFFDLDHTLWDFDLNSAYCYQLIFKKFKIFGIDQFNKAYPQINVKLWNLYRKDQISKEVVRNRRLKETFEVINHKIDDSLINLIVDEYRALLPLQTRLIHNTKDILNRLKIKYDLHIITNGFHQVQIQKLENSGIRDYFHSIISPDISGVKKPNPKIFMDAMSIANTNPCNSLMIGDGLEEDVLGPMRIGMKSIWYNPKRIKNEEVFSINELSQILTVLA